MGRGRSPPTRPTPSLMLSQSFPDPPPSMTRENDPLKFKDRWMSMVRLCLKAHQDEVIHLFLDFKGSFLPLS